jgi:hypothetical protein
VSSLSASERVKAPPAFAAAYAGGYLARLRGTDARLRLHLRAPLADLGIPGGVELQRDVVAAVSPSAGGDADRAGIAITWEPQGGGPFPTFTGTLFADPADTGEECSLCIAGSYQPPGGIAGDVFDGAIGFWIARATAHDLLRQLRDLIEADYTTRRQMA